MNLRPWFACEAPKTTQPAAGGCLKVRELVPVTGGEPKEKVFGDEHQYEGKYEGMNGIDMWGRPNNLVWIYLKISLNRLCHLCLLLRSALDCHTVSLVKVSLGHNPPTTAFLLPRMDPEEGIIFTGNDGGGCGGSIPIGSSRMPYMDIYGLPFTMNKNPQC